MTTATATAPVPKARVTYQPGGSCFRLTDLANAGKRGKTCREAALYDLDYLALRGDGELAGNILGMLPAVQAIAERDGYDDAVDFLRRAHKIAAPFGLAFNERELRGVDVAPATFKPLTIRTAALEVEAGFDSFSAQCLRDKANVPTIIPPVRGAKATAVKAFYAFVRDHAAEIKTVTFDRFLRMLSAAGVRYHYFCAMD